MTGVTLFGCAKGVFFLNLRHDNYRDQSYAGLTFLFKEEQLFDEFEFQEAKQIFRKAKYFRGESYIPPEQSQIIVRRSSKQRSALISFDGEEPISEFHTKFPESSGFFKEDSFLSESAYLQMKLEEYVSYLLTHRWKDIKARSEFVDDVVMQKIQDEILAPKFLRCRLPDSFPSDEQICHLYDLIYALSLSIAISIKSMIALNPKVVETPLSFCLLPHPNSKNGYAVEAFYKPRTIGRSVCLDLKNSIAGRGFVKPEPRQESDMTHEDRYFYGLLSPVASDDGVWKENLNMDKDKHNKTQK